MAYWGYLKFIKSFLSERCRPCPTVLEIGVDMGQRLHSINASGYGSWPFIFLVEFDDDNIIEYGSDSINMEYGNTDDETTLSIANLSPADQVEVHITISDPALNVDPTGIDIWQMYPHQRKFS